MSRQGRRRRQGLWDDVRVHALSPEEQVRPAAFLRAGTVDAATLLVLRVVRRAVWPIIIVGAALAWINGEFTPQTFERLASPAEYLELFLSPLVVLALGWGLRILVNLAGLVLAAPLAQGAWVDGAAATSRGRRLVDLGYLSAGYRSVRWSYAVRREAVRRCGLFGRQMAWLELVGRIALPLAIVFFLWILTRDVTAS
ncbi:hypothetical protein [Isoptericola haloaureus]|uniref:RDD family protein n=1 Tax=Isoptericola haloaureus TaxID=1542902 RepID=A0ABU7Z357_9MICO